MRQPFMGSVETEMNEKELTFECPPQGKPKGHQLFVLLWWNFFFNGLKGKGCIILHYHILCLIHRFYHFIYNIILLYVVLHLRGCALWIGSIGFVFNLCICIAFAFRNESTGLDKPNSSSWMKLVSSRRGSCCVVNLFIINLKINTDYFDLGLRLCRSEMPALRSDARVCSEPSRRCSRPLSRRVERL